MQTCAEFHPYGHCPECGAAGISPTNCSMGCSYAAECALACTYNSMSKIIPAEGSLQQLILAKAAEFGFRSYSDIMDLFPFYSILVSTGWNKNTDVFSPVQLWRARSSPEDKPLNIMHDQKRIIGHIAQNICVGADLLPIPDDTAEGNLPQKMHLVTASVLYKIWEDPAAQAEITAIIDGITKGEWYVSMECIFRDFSYALLTATGEETIIERNKETASLTKYLRQYKGPGKIYNYTIGRLLKQITFSGVGLVKQPANPDSIISDSLNLFSSAASTLGYINLDNLTGDITMPEKTIADIVAVEDSVAYKSLLNQYETLKATATATKAELDHAKEHVTAKDKAEKDKLEKEVADLKKTIADMEEKMEKDSAAKKDKEMDFEKETASLKSANEAMTKTLDEYKKASRNSARAEALVKTDPKLTMSQALQTVAGFSEMSDEMFTGVLNMMSGYASKSPQAVTTEKVLETVKAEDVSYGTGNVDAFKATASSVKDFINSGRATKSAKATK